MFNFDFDDIRYNIHKYNLKFVLLLLFFVALFCVLTLKAFAITKDTSRQAVRDNLTHVKDISNVVELSLFRAISKTEAEQAKNDNRKLMSESIELEKKIQEIEKEKADLQAKLDTREKQLAKAKSELETKAMAQEKARQSENRTSAAYDVKRSYKPIKYTWNGSKLTKSGGVNYGPSGKETYYNLPMGGVISIMRGMGNHDKYWIRSDGCKMLGKYIIVAANLKVHPRGSHVRTSLGMAVVCDTGSFASSNPHQLDLAVDW